MAWITQHSDEIAVSGQECLSVGVESSQKSSAAGEYCDAFCQQLEAILFEGQDVHHDPGRLEGEHWLTPEIAAELVAYPRELLLTRAWCIICRKA